MHLLRTAKWYIASRLGLKSDERVHWETLSAVKSQFEGVLLANPFSSQHMEVRLCFQFESAVDIPMEYLYMHRASQSEPYGLKGACTTQCNVRNI